MQGSASALPFPDANFDAICAMDLIEYLVDDGVLAELARVAK